MRVLCVAEKPSIAKSISQILSGGHFTTSNTNTNYVKNYEFDYPQTNSSYTVTCVSGHLTSADFFDSHRKWHSCDAFDLFDAPVEVTVAKDKKAIEQNLKTQARRADMLMIWTDCDREGEHIGLEVVRVCLEVKRNIIVKRARFSAIIAQQIHNAAQHPVELNRAHADAVEARIMLDLKVGAAFTRMQTMILQARCPQLADQSNVISYGPCQFPTLGFVVQQYNRVQAFRPEKFWYIYLSLSRPSSSQEEYESEFKWRRNHLFDHKTAACLYHFVMSQEPVVARVRRAENKGTKKWKPLPLTTVELQKAGSRLLKLAPKTVLDIAERLYQQGFVSYPRTETDQYDPQFDFMTLIAKQTTDPAWGPFATSLQEGGFATPRKGKNNDKAHPPIHPTAHAGNLEGNDKKVYEFITRRFLACCSKDAEGWLTTVDVVCGGEDFFATGLVVLQRNYLLVYPYDKWVGNVLPEFEEGEEFQPTVLELREGQTSKPNYLTEADLVSLMDKNGIGTDATIAQHIETIIQRDYVIERMEGTTKYLVPSTLGVGLIEGYNQIGLHKSVSKPTLRRETERRMVQVCEGQTTKNDMVIQSIDQYKEMFIIVKREFDKVVTSVRQRLNGNGDAQEGGNAGGDGGNGGGGAGGGGGDAGGGGGGRRGRGGRGAGNASTRGRKPSTPSNRGRRQGSAPGGSTVLSDDDDDNPPAPPAAQTRTRKAHSSRIPASVAPPSRTLAPVASTSATYTGTLSSINQANIHRAASSLNNTMGEAPMCICNIPAVRRTATSESASKGKERWACRNGSCGYFKWVDDRSAVPDQEPRSVVPAKRPYQDPINSGPLRMCSCPQPEEAALRTVVKDNENKGRKFWKCPKPEGTNCKFFEWDDEPPRVANIRPSISQAPINVSASGSSDICYKCNEVGHWAKACPKDGNDVNKRVRSLGSTVDASAPSGTCYKCQQPGHYSSNCPSTAGSKSKSAGGNNMPTGECFKCGESGHWSKDCSQGGAPSRTYPKARSNSNGGGSSKRGGRDQGTAKGGKRGRPSKKKSAFGAADGR